MCTYQKLKRAALPFTVVLFYSESALASNAAGETAITFVLWGILWVVNLVIKAIVEAIRPGSRVSVSSEWETGGDGDGGDGGE